MVLSPHHSSVTGQHRAVRRPGLNRRGQLTDIITPEVNGILFRATVEVMCDVCTDLFIIVGRIPDTEPTLDVLLDMRLGVPLYVM